LVLYIQGTGKTIAIGSGVENIVPLDLIAIIFGRTLKGSVFGGLKTTSDLSIIADKCQKEVIIIPRN
jgi:S-(hydroxymethyl)glutathione dehydrogenase/alcohol dehydrogenase